MRRSYAKRIMARAMIDDPRIEAAFAEVRRENFLGQAPGRSLDGPATVSWRRAATRFIFTWTASSAFGPTATSTVGGPREMRFGSPAPHTAILAHVIGRSGRLTAIEFDPELAACARANLLSIPHTQVIEGDGAALLIFDLANVMYVNAGATRPADMWLDRLAEGGRLIRPLTTDGFPNAFHGAIFRTERRAEVYHARWVSPDGIFPCEGGRDPDSERALSAAFKKRRLGGGAEALSGR